MLDVIKVSLKNFNYKLYFALLVLGFVPTIYTTVRVFLVGQLPDDWSYSIAGQLSWVNLLYEILNEAVILPLFYFVGRVKVDKKALANLIRTGFVVLFSVFGFLSVILILFTEPVLSFMATDTSIIELSASYIRIESVANVFSVLSQFVLVVLISTTKRKYLYTFTVSKLLLCLAFDAFLASRLPISLDLGVNGIGYSNIIVNFILLIVSIFVLSKENIKVFNKIKLDFLWLKELLKVGGISGLESFVRNLAYMVMISRMVNIVGEQGTYWVANSFIWGWLLLPVLQLGELVKKEVSGNRENIHKRTLGYFSVTTIICTSWFISIPLWKPFMVNILDFDDADKLFNLVLLLVGFYVLYAFQNVFDSTFYGVGKTSYMLIESVVTNVIYYGFAFLLYITNIWTPTLTGIALLFGIGNAFDSLVSFLVYRCFLKKEHIKLI